MTLLDQRGFDWIWSAEWGEGDEFRGWASS